MQQSAFDAYEKEIAAIVAKVRRTGCRETVKARDGAEIYACPLPRAAGHIAWGVNAAGTGFNVLRGIRRPDGIDEAIA